MDELPQSSGSMSAGHSPSDRRISGFPETESPILVVPFMWIGDFVRCHTVARLLKERWPHRPVDFLSTSLTAPLVDYMPGVRRAVIADIPHGRLALKVQAELARRLRGENYGIAFIMSRKWKAALAPFAAGIPKRVGFLGEARFGLINDIRPGEKQHPRMIDQCAALVLPRGTPVPEDLPLPQVVVPAEEITAWRQRRGLPNGPVVALAPGAVGPSKRWPAERYGRLAGELARQGLPVWIVGGPGERALAQEIVAVSSGAARDLTGDDLRDAIIALASAALVVSNDSGLMHVAAAAGAPTIGIFGPTSPWHWAPLNPLAATIVTNTPPSCQPCHRPTCRMLHHQCMQTIETAKVLEASRAALARSAISLV